MVIAKAKTLFNQPKFLSLKIDYNLNQDVLNKILNYLNENRSLFAISLFGEGLFSEAAKEILIRAKEVGLATSIDMTAEETSINKFKNIRNIVNQLRIWFELNGDYEYKINYFLELLKKERFNQKIIIILRGEKIDKDFIVRISKLINEKYYLSPFIILNAKHYNEKIIIKEFINSCRIITELHIKNPVKIFIDNPLCGIINMKAKNFCPAGRISFHLDSNGNIKPCHLVKLSLGNIKTDKIDTVWKKMMSLHNQSKCLICKYYRVCGGGCLANKNDILDKDLLCSYFIKLNDKIRNK
ncbi:MAG: hypothetical protein US74_C0023G0008 [Parcubacteria group bacterium GW2011_GWA2_38_13]|nr:MAG: hypothetical protein US74_C0023G0008 [Parcubacteria group bacterium GW2011_GWA2_38_13]